MGYGWGFGQCAPKCTHRKLTDDPEILWSAGVANCANPTVLDSCIDASGNVFIVGRWHDKTNFGFARQIDPADGSAIWTKHYRGTIHCCTTDGTSLWIAGESLANSIGLPTENLFKLDPDDGETVWSVTSWHQVIYDCIHDGAGKVYVCGTVNPYQSGEFNWSDPGGDYGNYLSQCGYASLYDGSGTREDSFGGSDPYGVIHWDALTQDQALSMGLVGPTAFINPYIPSQGIAAYSIDIDGDGNIFIGSDVWVSGCSSVGTCGNVGSVAKFKPDHSLEWLFGNRVCSAVRCYDGDLYCGFNKTIVGISPKGEFEPFAQLQRWTTDEVTRVWGRTLQVDKPFVEGEDIRPVGVTDIEVSDTGVYVTHQWWVSKLDHTGGYEWSSRHAKNDVRGEPYGTTYYTVELDPSEETETLYVGGRGANCNVDDQDDSETPVDGACEPTWVCEQKPNTRGPHGGIYSWICPGKEIACEIPDVFYGTGCFSEVEPIPYTWRWNDMGWYQGVSVEYNRFWFTTFEVPCGDYMMSVRLEARQVSGSQCDGWDVTVYLSGPIYCLQIETFSATVTECNQCDALGAGEYVFDFMPFKWSASLEFDEDCPCCDMGGGGNKPPGVLVDCCENEIPLTLTAEFTGSSGCACLNGLTVSLAYNNSLGYWESAEIIGQGCVLPTRFVRLLCTGGEFALKFFCGDSLEEDTIAMIITSCDPFIISGSLAPPSACCDGDPAVLSVTVTE